MIISLIYKEYFTKNGDTTDIELIECDENRVSAAKFAKLYNLQLPKDLRDTVVYKSLDLKILDKYSKDGDKFAGYAYDEVIRARQPNVANINVDGVANGGEFVWPPPPLAAPVAPVAPAALAAPAYAIPRRRPAAPARIILANPVAPIDDGDDEDADDLPF